MAKLSIAGAMLVLGMIAGSLAAQIAPPGEAPVEILLEATITGVPDGVYSRFGVTITAATDATIEPDPSLPASMPTITVTAFQLVLGEEVAADAFIADTAFWGAVADLMSAAEGLDPAAIDLIPPSQGRQAAEAATSFLEATNATRPAQGALMAHELAEGVELNDIQVQQPVQGQPGPGNGAAQFGACPQPWYRMLVALSRAITAHIALALRIVDSTTTCQAPPDPVASGLVKCAIQMTAWGVAAAANAAAWGSTPKPKILLDDTVAMAASDGIGQQLQASQANAEAIARRSKEAEQALLVTQSLMPVALPFVATISIFGDAKVSGTANRETLALAVAVVASRLFGTCLHRVIAPRFEANAVRVRLFAVDAGGAWQPIAHDRGWTGTSLARDKAREAANIWTVDVDKLYATNPSIIDTFDEVDQTQAFSLRICEGVVVGPDAGSLYLPSQDAGTDYWYGEAVSGPSGISEWWRGILETETLIIPPWPAASVHEACEDEFNSRMIDNNNDGIAEPTVEDECILLPTSDYPDGQVEQDIAVRPIVADQRGITAWNADTVDMHCNDFELPLISQTVTQAAVEQELVLAVASRWTEALDGGVIDHHAKDSTQIRIKVTDPDWGAPRPRNCYQQTEPGADWVCRRAIPACQCPPPPGQGPGQGPGL